MKSLFKSLLISIFLISTSAHAADYQTDLQAQYPDDQAQESFQFASFISCFLNAMAPQVSVGVGQYLAYVDENKCEDSGASSNSSSADSGSTVIPPSYAKALTTVTQGSSGELIIEALVSITDTENNVQIPKQIQVLGVINSGPTISPPYGSWDMDFCSSTVGAVGSCNDGQGLLRVRPTGITSYTTNTQGWTNSAKSVFTGTGGVTGYGASTTIAPRASDNQNAIFAFDQGKYSLQSDRNDPSSQVCYNPSMNGADVRHSAWETYLYNTSTLNRIAYTNPGFYLKSNLTSNRTIGSVSYWGVNFWNEAVPADQIDGATLIRADDASQIYTLKIAPGRLERVSTSTSTGLALLDGVPLTIGFWGYNTGSNGINSGSDVNVNNAKVYQWLTGVVPTSTNISLKASWSSANSYFTFTGYEICGNTGCSQSSLSSPVNKTIAQLTTFGVSDVHSWISGVNISYSFRVSEWLSGTLIPINLAQIRLIKRSSEIMAPTDSSIPTQLHCIGNCPALSSGNLINTQSNTWPPTTKVDLTWSPTRGAPLISSTPVDWSGTGSGRHYELFDTNSLSLMDCPAAGAATGGYCTDLYKRGQNVTYYTWQSGNQWDTYRYLVNRSTQAVVSPNPPLSLSYTVPNTPGNISGYIGKTITVQSPNPGTLWLPGSCVDSARRPATCSANTKWMNDVSIPTATDETGKVTLLNAGTPTSTQYLAKWLKRGVYFGTLPSGSCSSLASSLSLASSVQLPGISDANQSVKTLSWPSSSSAFDVNPRVIHGVLQTN